jgi:gliding motility-associated-like protein
MILRKSTLLSLFTFLMFQFISIGQPLPLVEFNVSSGMGLKGDKVCLDVTVNNFINVQSIQLSLSYNAALVSPDCPFDLSNSALPNVSSQGLFNCNNSNNGFVKFVWDNAPTTLPDGSLMFTICFTLIGDAGNISPVFINGQLLDVEIGQVDNTGKDVSTDEIVSNAGTIMIKSNTLAAFLSKCDADANNVAAGGSVTFYATAGTPPYSYTITPGPITGNIAADGQRVTIPNILSGFYTLNITDASGLQVSRMFNMSDNNPIMIDSSFVKPPRCFGSRNGSIEIKSVSGGITPYKYDWSNLVTGIPKVEDLRPGIYTVTITDFSGCSKTQDFDLSVDTLKFNLVLKDSSACSTAKTGIITIENATGGKKFSNYDYEYLNVNGFGNPKPFTSPFDIINVGAGINTIRISDTLGCSVEKMINVPVKKTVKIDTVEFIGISCFGKSDGSIRLMATPGQGYGYIPSTNLLNTGNQGGVFIANNVGPGSYSVVARDNLGCADTLKFDMIEPAPININPVVVQPDCVNTGSITLIPTGGTGTYTYAWTPDVGNVSSQTGLAGGPISVTVSDVNGCKEIYSTVLNQQGALNIQPTVENQISCVDKNDATLNVLINSANGPFNVVWTNSSNMSISNMTKVNNVGPGTYTVVVTDKNGCSNSRTVTVNQAQEITIITQITNAPCFDDLGKIEVSVSGNSAGFTYEWRLKGESTVISTNNTINAKAGIYTVKAISPGGCNSEVEVMITQPAHVELGQPDVINNVKCKDGEDGSAAYLNLNKNYKLIWSDPNYDGNFVVGKSGEYWVIAIDTISKCSSDTVRFEIGTKILLSLDQNKTIIVNPTCYGDMDGSITVEATGGANEGYKYVWSTGATQPTISNLNSGQYIVTISDINNCTQSDTFNLTQPDKLSAFLDKNRSVELDCNNQDKGKIALLTSGGNPGIKTISWQSGVMTESGVAVELSSGTYCATISDNFGCKDTFCYTMIAPKPLEGEMNIPEEPLCNGGQTCISVKTISGGTGNKYTFQINNGIRYPLDTCVVVYAGQYSINLIDSAGCQIEPKILLTIDQPDPIIVDLGPDLEVQLGLPAPLINVSIDSPAGVDTILWSPIAGIDCITTDCRTIEASPTETTTYVVTVTDQNGCTATDDVTVKVKNVRNVYFANIFTPNRDGNNDFFQAVTGPGVEQILSFAIYDRWGNRVFEKTNYIPDPAGTDGWDGTFGGKRLDPGVFVYFAKALFIDGKVIDYSGSVTLADRVKN